MLNTVAARTGIALGFRGAAVSVIIVETFGHNPGVEKASLGAN
jgi:hypothetical protein